MPEEVGCEHFLQAVSGEPVLLRQDALSCRKHADDMAAMETRQIREGESSRIEAKHLETSMHLEKRPLKKALMSNWGFGMMPAFR